MAKIGTAHIEIKPVVDEAALDALAARIEEAVTRGVERALARSELSLIRQDLRRMNAPARAARAGEK